MNDFATAIDRLPKIVFSSTLETTGWNTATLATKEIDQVVSDLKRQSGKDILIGSRSLIIQLINLRLIDEFQICIHPIIEGKGLKLFDRITDRTVFKLAKTKRFDSGVIVLYYELKK